MHELDRISHAIYFHGLARADEWLLFAIDSSFAGGGIGSFAERCSIEREG